MKACEERLVWARRALPAGTWRGQLSRSIGDIAATPEATPNCEVLLELHARLAIAEGT